MSRRPLSILLITPDRFAWGFLQEYLAGSDAIVTVADRDLAEDDALRQTHFDLILIVSNLINLECRLIIELTFRCDVPITVIGLTPSIRGDDLCDLVLERPSELRFFLDTIRYLTNAGNGSPRKLRKGEMKCKNFST